MVRALDLDRLLAFDCPCAEHHRLLLDLDMNHEPSWAVRVPDPLTVWPSVDYRHEGRRCHYVIRHGEVRWALNDD